MSETVIEAGKGSKEYFRDLWRYRELFFFLAWRDLLVRYKQTVIGIAWSVVRPVLTMLVFTFIFGKIAQLPSHGIPYPLLVFSAMLPWQFFATSFTESSNSLIANSNMISKIYFPRVIIPTTSIIVGLVDFVISLTVMICLMAWYAYAPGWNIVYMPFFLILSCLLSLGAGLWVSALNVQYRDFRYVVPFLVQFGLYISPVGFGSSVIPEKWHLLYSLNPMVGIINGFRWSLLGGSIELNAIEICFSIATILILLVTGLVFFRNTERRFADVI